MNRFGSWNHFFLVWRVFCSIAYNCVALKIFTHSTQPCVASLFSLRSLMMASTHKHTTIGWSPCPVSAFQLLPFRLIYVQFPMSFVFPWSLIMRNWYFLFPFLHLLWESVVTCNAEKMFLLLNYYLRVSICLFFYVTFRIGCVKSLSVSE